MIENVSAKSWVALSKTTSLSANNTTTLLTRVTSQHARGSLRGQNNGEAKTDIITQQHVILECRAVVLEEDITCLTVFSMWNFNSFQLCMFFFFFWLLPLYSAANSRPVKCAERLESVLTHEVWCMTKTCEWKSVCVLKTVAFSHRRCALHCPLYSIAAHQQLLHLWHSLKRSQANG